MAKALVSGGAGFIGSHIATRLVELGHQVRVLDNFSTGNRRNLEHLAGRHELIEGDLRDAEVCFRACEEIEYVFHEAALGSVPKSIEEPLPSHDCNIGGTFNILLAAVKQKVRRFIYAGSSSAYGDTEVSPKHEGLTPSPLSPYAVQKLTGEHYCRAFFECYGLQTITLRYFNVFGARQDPKSRYAAVIPAFVVAALHDESPVVYGDGEQSRDFTYIDNVVDGNMLAMNVPMTKGETVNVACGGQITINQTLTAINKALGTNIKAKYEPARAGDVRHSCADISLAKKLLRFEPKVGFDEGLKRAIVSYRAAK
ncbi:MAG: SDR family oxidoreductase [Planctomycetes bacterium]|nr:SDR family oxidoreductase [Planctomycetota bacterium]